MDQFGLDLAESQPRRRAARRRRRREGEREPAHAPRVAAMTALLQQEMKRHADDTPLTVANPKPAAWTPPAPNQMPADPTAARKAKGKASKKS